MQDNWYWFRFLRYMENGDFDDAIRRVQEYSQSPVHLGMEAYPFNKVPDPDKERPSSQDSLDFLVSTPNIKLEIFKPAKGVLSEFKECSDLRALAEKLNFSADVHYFWIDLHLGVYLQYGTKETGHWESRQIWRNSLEPWIEWIE